MCGTKKEGKGTSSQRHQEEGKGSVICDVCVLKQQGKRGKFFNSGRWILFSFNLSALKKFSHSNGDKPPSDEEARVGECPS